jgi:hypothetical protein
VPRASGLVLFLAIGPALADPPRIDAVTAERSADGSRIVPLR